MTFTGGGSDELSQEFVNKALEGHTESFNTVIGAGINSIGDNAFYDCGSKLITVSFSDSNVVTNIGKYAFCQSGLTSVSIPKKVTTIGGYAFYDCGSLATVEFAADSELTTIGNYAFYQTKITSISIPKEVTEIGGYAFYNCGSLATVEFAADSELTTIGKYAFCQTKITSISIPKEVTEIGNYAFAYCGILATVKFAADSVLKTIGDQAFCQSGLTSISIPKTVTKIGNYAFADCGSLTEVVFADDSALTTIGDNAFFNSGIKSISIPKAVTKIGNSVFVNCGSLATVKFAADSEVTTIGDSAFYQSGLTSISIPTSVTTIESYAFSQCHSLLRIEIQKDSNLDSDKCGSGIVYGSPVYMLAHTLPDKGLMSKFTSTQVWYITDLGSGTADEFYVVDLNGGTLKEDYAQNGYTLPKESNISKSGSSLVGWLQSDDNSAYVGTVSKGKPVQAIWGTNVVIDNNGATTEGSLSSIAINAEKPLISLDDYAKYIKGIDGGFVAPTKSGFTFDGYWDSEYKVKYYNADGSPHLTTGITLPSDNKLYAKWNALVYLGYYKAGQTLVLTDEQYALLSKNENYKTWTVSSPSGTVDLELNETAKAISLKDPMTGNDGAIISKTIGSDKYQFTYKTDGHVHDGVYFDKSWGDGVGETTSLPTEAGNYYLTKDVKLSDIWTPTGNVNLCLNGHVIEGDGSTYPAHQVIQVNNGITLNLYDCGSTAHYFEFAESNKWKLGTPSGSPTEKIFESIEAFDRTEAVTFLKKAEGNKVYIKLTGGCITGGENCGVSVNGTFTLSGGNIVGNSSSVSVGGGVCVEGTGFMMNGGNIVGNYCYGGSGGGGVYLKNGTFEMTGGNIIGNVALRGGGVSCEAGSFSMTGGIIKDNYAEGSYYLKGIGGGIRYLDGDITVGGTAVVTGNLADKKETSPVTDNVYLPDGKTITLGTGEYALKSDASIGVTLGDAEYKPITGAITSNGSAGDVTYFSSDDDDYGVKFVAATADKAAHLELAEKYTVTFDLQGHGSEIQSQSVVSGGLVTEPTDPTATGYTFAGWYKEAACTTAWDFDNDTVSGDTTLYAKWTVSVTLDGTGGNWDPAGPLMVQDKSVISWTDTAGSVAVSLNGTVASTFTYVPSSVKFSGFKLDDTELTSGTSTITAAGTLRAITTELTTVTISAGTGGSVDKTSISGVEVGSEITVSENKLKVGGTTVTATAGTGYDFDSWNAEDKGKVTKGMTITASFKKIDYSIEYGPFEHGSVTGRETAQMDDTVTLTVTPQSGYRFVSGSLTCTTEEGEEVPIINNTFTMPADNVTISASFDKIPTQTTSFSSSKSTVVDGVIHFDNAVVVTDAYLPNATNAKIVNTSGNEWYNFNLSADGMNGDGALYFQVPLDVIEVKGYTETDVALIQNNAVLPTTLVGEDGGYATYTAEINGSGTYGIGFRDGATLTDTEESKGGKTITNASSVNLGSDSTYVTDVNFSEKTSGTVDVSYDTDTKYGGTVFTNKTALSESGDGSMVIKTMGIKKAPVLIFSSEGGNEQSFHATFNVEAAVSSGKVNEIAFKVPLSELKSAGFTTSDVILYHGNETTGEWIPLDTYLVKTDGTYAYYKAETDGASPFGIMFMKDKTIVEDSSLQTTTETKKTEETTAKSPVPVLGILAGLGAAAVMLRRK